MKKVLLVMAVVAMILVGCSKDTNVFDYYIANSDWTPMNNEYHYVKIDIPQITREVAEHGIVEVTNFYEDNGIFYYSPLPAIITDVDTNGNHNATLIDFDYTVGKLYIYVTPSNLNLFENPGDLSFRVAIRR